MASAANAAAHAAHKKILPVSVTHSDRATWRFPTSDVIGSHLRDDLDSYLSLVRRKIQEKYSTTRDLIIGIGRLRSGRAGLVTPVEFRYTLIKLGIMMPPEMCDQIFIVFDEDRSGSINFDEFSTWVMNSEFKVPAVKHDPNSLHNKEDEALRIKLLKCAEKYPECFDKLGKKTNFKTFYESVNKRFVRLTLPDAKRIFEIFDPNNTGFLDGGSIIRLAGLGCKADIESESYSDYNGNNGNSATYSNGINNHNPINDSYDSNDTSNSNSYTTNKNINTEIDHSESNSNPGNVKETMIKLCGKNSHILEFCFATADSKKASKLLNYENFVRLLKEGGMCKNMSHVRELFMTLGGGSGFANIPLLLATIPLAIADTVAATLAATAADKDASTVKNFPSSKKVESEISRHIRLDRLIRESMRHCYRVMKINLEAADTNHTGFLDLDVLRRIVVAGCCPVTKEDFRIVAKNLNSNMNGTRVSWIHFMQVYSTRSAPHALEGTGFSDVAIKLRKKYFMTNPHMFTTVDRPSHPCQRPVTAMTSRIDAFSNFDSPVSTMTDTSGERAFVDTFNHRTDRGKVAGGMTRPKTAGVSLGGHSATNSLQSFEAESGSNISSLKRRIAASRAMVTSTLNGIHTAELGEGEQLGTVEKIAQGMLNTRVRDDTAVDKEARKTWTNVLRDCHGADPESLGYVSFEDFIAALNNGSLRSILDDESKIRIAQKYSVPGSEFLLVDYLLCFRTYLNQAAQRFNSSASSPELGGTTDHDLKRSPSSSSAFVKHSPSLFRNTTNLHPWDFDYKRTKNQSHPYWSLATQQKNEKHLDFAPEIRNSMFLSDTGIGGESINLKNDEEKRKRIGKKKQDRIDINNHNNNMKNNNSNNNSPTNTNNNSNNGTINTTNVSVLTDDEQILSKKHSNDVIVLCYRCYEKFKNNWSEIIKEFKSHQIIGLRGKILDQLFLSILKKKGVSLNVWESPKLTHSFRVFGMRGVTDYNEFFKVCQLASSRIIQIARVESFP